MNNEEKFKKIFKDYVLLLSQKTQVDCPKCSNLTSVSSDPKKAMGFVWRCRDCKTWISPYSKTCLMERNFIFFLLILVNNFRELTTQSYDFDNNVENQSNKHDHFNCTTATLSVLLPCFEIPIALTTLMAWVAGRIRDCRNNSHRQLQAIVWYVEYRFRSLTDIYRIMTSVDLTTQQKFSRNQVLFLEPTESLSLDRQSV